MRILPNAVACPFCQPAAFDAVLPAVPRVQVCAAHLTHPLADLVQRNFDCLEQLDQQPQQRPIMSAAEHNAFPKGRY